MAALSHQRSWIATIAIHNKNNNHTATASAENSKKKGRRLGGSGGNAC
jgi:hypothetical protein